MSAQLASLSRRDGRAKESPTPCFPSTGSDATSTIAFEPDFVKMTTLRRARGSSSGVFPYSLPDGIDLNTSFGSDGSAQSADSGLSDMSTELASNYLGDSFSSVWSDASEDTPTRNRQASVEFNNIRNGRLSIGDSGIRSLQLDDIPGPGTSRATRIKKPTRKRAGGPEPVPDISTAVSAAPAAPAAPMARLAIRAPKHDCSAASPLNASYDDDLILGPVGVSEDSVATAFRKGGKDHIQLRVTTVDAAPSGDMELSHETFVFDELSKVERWQHFGVHRGLPQEGGRVPFAVFTSSMNAPDMTLWTLAGDTDAAPIAWQGKIPLETYPMLLKVFGNVLYVGGKNSHYNDLKEKIPTGELLTFALDETNPGAPTKIATHTFLTDLHGVMAGDFKVPQLFDGVTQLDSNGSTVAVCGNPAATVRYKDKTDNAGVVKRRRICPQVRDTVHYHAIELLTIGENGAPLADGTCHRRIPDAHNQTITGIEWQGETLFSCGWDSKIKIWHVPHIPADQPDYRLEHSIDCVLPASISAGLGGGAFLTTGMDGYLRLWPNQGKKTDNMPVDRISFSSKSLSTPQTLVVVGRNGTKGLFTGHSSTPTELDPDWFRGVRAWDIQEHGRPEARMETKMETSETDDDEQDGGGEAE